MADDPGKHYPARGDRTDELLAAARSIRADAEEKRDDAREAEKELSAATTQAQRDIRDAQDRLEQEPLRW